jgi:hypothetical protein
MSDLVPSTTWISVEDDLLLSLTHKDYLGGDSAIHRDWDQIAAYMNLVQPRDADNACFKMYTLDNVCSRYRIVLMLRIQEITLPPIKENAGEMAQPYMAFQGHTEPPPRSEGKDFVLFPRAFDCRLEPGEELLGNKR